MYIYSTRSTTFSSFSIKYEEITLRYEQSNIINVILCTKCFMLLNVLQEFLKLTFQKLGLHLSL